MAVAGRAGRIRSVDRLAPVRPQPCIPLASRAIGGRCVASRRLEEGVMTFDRVWVLAIAWLPLAWMVYEWRRTTRRVPLALKALSLVAILIALAEPRLNVNETKVALAVLVDTSASVSQNDLQRESQLANTIAGERGRNWLRVIPFARSTRTLESSEDQRPFHLQLTSGEN